MEKLKEFRKSMGVSQEAMAKKLGITLSMYEKVEQGRANASAGFMKRFKYIFPEASIDDIFFTAEQQGCCCLGTRSKRREWLISLRKEHKMTRAQLAEAAGISVSYVDALERGQRIGPAHTVKKLAAVLGFSIERFYEDEQ